MDNAAENTINGLMEDKKRLEEMVDNLEKNLEYIHQCLQRIAVSDAEREGKGVLLSPTTLMEIQKMEDALVDISEKTICPYAKMTATQALADWSDDPLEEER